jgi:putative hydrolase of the HAD superfamily
MPGGVQRTVSRVVLFDLDETLYSAEAGVMDHFRARVLTYLCTRMMLPRAEADALRRSYLQEYGTTLQGLQSKRQVDTEDYLRYVHDIPLEKYLRANPELDAVLAGIPLAKVIFTNASREHAERVLALLAIRRHFARIVDIRDVEFQSKPQPGAYRRICDLLGVQPRDCMIVEDSIRNLRPAKALGMSTVLVHDGEREPDESVDVTIRRIEQVGDALARLSAPAPQAPPQLSTDAGQVE